MLEVLLVLEAVVVAVTRHKILQIVLQAVLLVFSSQALMAATLPEDQADILYHSYNGGGVEITGPSILVSKKVLDDLSISANYYVDMVS